MAKTYRNELFGDCGSMGDYPFIGDAASDSAALLSLVPGAGALSSMFTSSSAAAPDPSTAGAQADASGRAVQDSAGVWHMPSLNVDASAPSSSGADAARGTTSGADAAAAALAAGGRNSIAVSKSSSVGIALGVAAAVGLGLVLKKPARRRAKRA